VLHARFKFVDSRNIYFGARANRGGGILRDLADFRKRFRGGKLDFQPLCKFVRVTPNLTHFLAGVTWNQFFLLKRRRKKMRVLLRISIVHDTAETAGLFVTESTYMVLPGVPCPWTSRAKLLAAKTVSRT
jgi:hypothetical protein